MMKFEDIVSQLTLKKYAVLTRAVELGKWPDGRTLGAEERETSLQILIAYDARHKPVHERIGYVPPKTGDACEHDEEDHHDDLAGSNIFFKG